MTAVTFEYGTPHVVLFQTGSTKMIHKSSTKLILKIVSWVSKTNKQTKPNQNPTKRIHFTWLVLILCINFYHLTCFYDFLKTELDLLWCHFNKLCIELHKIMAPNPAYKCLCLILCNQYKYKSLHTMNSGYFFCVMCLCDDGNKWWVWSFLFYCLTEKQVMLNCLMCSLKAYYKFWFYFEV